ncbi:MAG: hypothetical protein ACJ746_05600 [Bryobacteraceae bacterium]
MREEVISIPTERAVNRVCTLGRRIPAILLQEPISQDGKGKLGPILHLPAESDVEVCGDGFNSRTVKVWYNGLYYFVFAEDLLA